MPKQGEIFASIDIGSQKIAVLIAEKESERISVFGQAIGESAGVKDGHIVNVAQAAEAVAQVFDKAQESCNTNVDGVAFNISDPHLKTINQNRQVPTETGVVSAQDMNSAINSASAIATLTNKQKLSTEVNHFLLDEDPQPVENPLGMQAALLGANVHIEIVSSQAYKNLHKLADQAQLAVSDLVLDSVASSEYCLSDEQKQSGVCLLDIGASTMNFSIFTAGGITHSSVLTPGADQITQAIADAFDTNFAEAERLKKDYGYATLEGDIEDKLIQFEQANSSEERYLSRHDLIRVIEKAYHQLLHSFKQHLKEQRLDRALRAGIVLVGGGAKIRHCEQLLLKTLRIRSKIAQINTDKITVKQSIATDPSYASALGLLVHAYSTDEQVQEIEQDGVGIGGRFKKIFDL